VKTFAEIAFTTAVQGLQEKHGSRATYSRMQRESEPGDGLGAREAEYLANADSFYLASVGETGWPYVQHRGGPRGFLKLLSPTCIVFADFRGNRQFVTAGNCSADDRVSLIIVDYPNRRRLKILGRLRFIDISDADRELSALVELPEYRANIEWVAMIEVEAFDWNCPQHITPRFTLAQVEAASQSLHARIAELEAEATLLREAASRKV